MQALIAKLKTNYPRLLFEPGSRFTWSPKTGQIIYKQDAQIEDEVAVWSLFHEVGHALLGHKNFRTDFELLQLEMNAWEEAKAVANQYDYEINSDHIEDCLDTYRDWLYQRSSCPNCTNCSLQINSKTYCCFNCGSTWRVSASRLCRPYRLKQPEILV